MNKGSSLAIWASGLGLALLIVGPASAGGGGGGGPCSGFSEGDQLVMRDNCFDGVAHFSESGSTLVVENSGIIPHTYTAVEGSFDTGILKPGESSEIHLDSEGVVRVWCTLHGNAHGGGMSGVLLIGESIAAGKAVQSPVRTDLRASSRQISIESLDSLNLVGRIEESLELSSRTTSLVVLVTGGLLGLLVIGMARRSSQSGSHIESAERTANHIDMSD